MVQHEGLERKLFHKLDSGRQLPRENQQVVPQTVAVQLFDAAQEVFSHQKTVVWLVLRHVAYPGKLGIEPEACQLLAHLGRAQVNPADHTPDERIFGGKLQQPAGLFQRLARLHGYGSLQTQRALEPLQILGQPVLLERSARTYPGILLRAVLPEMLVGVDFGCHGAKEALFIRQLKPKL